jgi:2-polyprenyl-6-methoxyphenol hydroxylase-like FAD-dependent oxidoreductase
VRLAREGKEEEEARFRYAIGCDGAHSAVRHALGIGFTGEAFPMMFMLGDVHIDWDLPRGLAMRALRLVEDGRPDMFIAIPLPEQGRYRVSMLAAPKFNAAGGTDHGIQSETRGPELAHIQAVADNILSDTIPHVRVGSNRRPHSSTIRREGFLLADTSSQIMARSELTPDKRPLSALKVARLPG